MKTIETLNGVLHRELALAGELLAAMRAMQRAIVEFHVEDLLAAIEREEQVLKPLETVERERLALVQALIPSGGNAVEQPTLSRLAVEATGDAEDRLRAAGRSLEDIVARIKEVNGQNRILLEHSIGFIRSTLRAVTEGYARKLIDQKV
jgi:flagellar biosynthesis/type III secretory pathway chaperone